MEVVRQQQSDGAESFRCLFSQAATEQHYNSHEDRWRPEQHLFSNCIALWSYPSKPTCQGEEHAGGQREGSSNVAQVATYEHLAAFFGGPPTENHFALYANWAKFGWGMVITGNVQVFPTHLTLGRDMTLPSYISEDSLEPFRKLASSILGPPKSKSDCLAIMQLSHAGRQSPNILGGRYAFQRPSGPSPVPIRPKGQGIISNVLHTVTFQTPHEMSEEDITDTIAAFVKGARVAVGSGFDGIQLHAAHGCE